MNRHTFTVLLIEDSPEYTQLVQRWLSRKDDVEFVLACAGTLAAGLDRLKNGNVDAILLDLGLPDSQGHETLVTAKAHAQDVPILLLSGSELEPLALQMITRGADDYYIMKSTCDGALLVKTLRFVVRNARKVPSHDAPAGGGSVIGIMGAKGGVGATTFACNLAIELRRQTQQDTLLIDLDMDAGLVSFLMNTETKHSILDAAASMQSLDHPSWNGMVAHDPNGVDIMPSPNLLGADSGAVGRIRDVLALVRTFYQWTVLDCGRLGGLSLSLLDRVTELYLVTMVGIPALHEAKKTIDALLRAGLEPHRLRLIVNQVGREEFSGSELSRMFGVPVYAKLPDAAKELDDAYVKRQVLAPSSSYRAQISSVARQIANLPDNTSRGPAAQLRSLADRFLRSNKEVVAVTREKC